MKKNLIAFIIFLSVFSFSFPATSNAQSYFGGNLVGTFICPCSSNIMLWIVDYAGGGLLTLFFGSGSNLLVGTPYGLYQTGSYGSTAQCNVPCQNGCCTIATGQVAGYGSPGFGTSN